jgi:hypothetical protein
LPAASSAQDLRGDGRASTPGIARLFEDALEGLLHTVGRIVLLRGERQSRAQDAIRIEPWRHALEGECALDEKRRAGQEQQRQRQCADDEQAAKAIADGAAAAAAGFAQRGLQIDLAARAAGARPKITALRERHADREQEDDPVEMRLIEAGTPGG